MKTILPLFIIFFLFSALLLNIMGLMLLIPLFITLPLLFLAIYLLLYIATAHNRLPKRMR